MLREWSAAATRNARGQATESVVFQKLPLESRGTNFPGEAGVERSDRPSRLAPAAPHLISTVPSEADREVENGICPGVSPVDRPDR